MTERDINRRPMWAGVNLPASDLYRLARAQADEALALCHEMKVPTP